MGRFLAGKGAQYALVLLFAVTVNFLLPRLMPGSPLIFLAGEDVGVMTPAQRAQLTQAFGLDQPLWRQYVRYLAELARGDLGHSVQAGRPVAEIIAGRVGWTLLLVGLSLVLATLAGVAWGAAAAWRRGRALDVGSLGMAMLLHSTPGFWLGMILIAVLAAGLRLFPVFGAMTPAAGLRGWAHAADVAWHLALPLVTLTLVTVPDIFLIMRASMLGVLGEPYIATARAKGVGDRAVMVHHAARNALLPVFTVFMLNLGYVVSGATVIETVFSYPGVGRLLFEAVLARDYPVLQGTFFVVTVSVIAANLVADLLYPLLDPRVRRGR